MKPKLIKAKPINGYEDMPFGSMGLAGQLTSVNSGFRTFMPTVDHDKCIMCLFCWVYCPEGCIDKENGKIEIDPDYCKGCGICANECPKKAITMVKECK